MRTIFPEFIITNDIVMQLDEVRSLNTAPVDQTDPSFKIRGLKTGKWGKST